MSKIRKILMGAAALTLPLVAATGTAGAATSHANSEFVSFVHHKDPVSKGITNLPKVGESVCSSFRSGDSLKTVMTSLLGQSHLGIAKGTWGRLIESIVASSVVYLCPQYSQSVANAASHEGAAPVTASGGYWIDPGQGPDRFSSKADCVAANTNTAGPAAGLMAGTCIQKYQ